MKLCWYCKYYPCQCGRSITETDIDYTEKIYEICTRTVVDFDISKILKTRGNE